MIAIAITLLAIGLGIYLLILIKINGLGNFYKIPAILFIVLSLSYNLCLMARGAIYHQKVNNILIERPNLK